MVYHNDLLRAVNVPGLMAGFDEVWLFDHGRPNKEVPLGIVLTSDAVNFNEQLPEGLETYMRETRCVLALGDGCGLNYATWDGEWHTWLVEEFGNN